MSCPVCPGCHEQRKRFTKCTVNGQGSKQYAKDTKHISVDEWDFIRSFGGEMFKNYLLTKHLKKVTACTSKLFQWLHPRNFDEPAEEGKQTGKKAVQKSATKKMAAGRSSSTKHRSGKSTVGKQAKPAIARAAPAAKSTSTSKSIPTRSSAQLTSIKPTPSIPFIQKFDFLNTFEFLPNADLFGTTDVSVQNREYKQSVAGSWFGAGGELLFPTVAAQAPTFRGESREESDSPYRDSFSGVGVEFPRRADWLGKELRHKFGRESASVEFDFGASPAAALSRQFYETFEPTRAFGTRDDDFRLKTFPENELHHLFGPDSRPKAYDALDYFAGQDTGFRFPEDFTHIDYFAQGEIGRFRTGSMSRDQISNQSPARLAAEQGMKEVEIFGGAGYPDEPIYAMRTGVPRQTTLGSPRLAAEQGMKEVEIFGGAGYRTEPIYAMRAGVPRQATVGREGGMKAVEIFGGAGYPDEPIYAGVPKQSTATERAARKLECVAGEASCVAGAQYLDVLPQSKRADTSIALGNTEVINYLQHNRLPRQGKHIGTALAAALNEAPKLMDSSQFSGLRFGPRETVAPKYFEFAREGRQVTQFGPRRMEASRFFTATNAPQQKHILRSPFGPGQLEISKYFTQTGVPLTRHLLRSKVEPQRVDTADLRRRNLEVLKHLTPTVRFRDSTFTPDALGTGNIAVIKSLIEAGALRTRGTVAPFALHSRNMEELKTVVKTGDPRLGNYFRSALGPRNVAAFKYLVQTGQLRKGNIVGIDGGGKSAYSKRFDGLGKEYGTRAARDSEEADVEYAADSERGKPLLPRTSAKEPTAYKNSQRSTTPTRAHKDMDYGGDGDYTRTRHRRPSPGRVPLAYTKFPAYAGMQPPELPRYPRVPDQQQLVEHTEHVRAAAYPRNTRALRNQEASPQLRRTSPHHANIMDRRVDAGYLGEPRRIRHGIGSPQRGPFTYARFPAYVGQQHKELQQPLAGGPHVGVQSKLPRGYENIRMPRFTRYQHRSSRPSEDVRPRKTFRYLTPTGFGREVSPSSYTRKYPYLQHMGDTDYGAQRKTRAYRFLQSPFKATKFARYMAEEVEPNNFPSKASPQRTEPHGTGAHGATSYRSGSYGGGPYSRSPFGTAPYSTGLYDMLAASKLRRKTRVQPSNITGSKDVILPPNEGTYIADEGYTGHKYRPVVNYLGSMNYGLDDLYQHERDLLEMERQRAREKERLASFVESLNLFYNIINKPDLEAELSSDEDEFSLNYGYVPDERAEAERKKLTLLEIVDLLRSDNKTRFHPVVYHEPFSKKKPWTWMQNFPTKIPAEYLRQLSVNTLTTLKTWQRQQALMGERANGKARDGRKKINK